MWKTSFVLFCVVNVQAFDSITFLHKGCFKDQTDNPDLPYKSPERSAFKTISDCVKDCASKFFIYAALQNAESCFCGNSFGRYGPSNKCRQKCQGAPNEVCGGLDSNSVYLTNVQVPGPPTQLKLEKATETWLSIKWQPPQYSIKDFITDYFIHVQVIESFDSSHNSKTFSPKNIQVTESSRMTVILGLRPGSTYNVTVSAGSVHGKGASASARFSTLIGKPDYPKAPILVHHHEHDHHGEGGEIHVQLQGLERNRYGPITKYRVLVVDETTPAPFLKDRVFGYEKAKALNLNYWIAAEMAELGQDLREFVVGDNKTYGGYWNFGPLPPRRDFHVTLGVVSSWNKVTKVTYAKVSHDQHALENVAVFKFGHEHEHHAGQVDLLPVILGVIIVILGVVLATGLAIYAFLRLSHYRRKQKRPSDTQELTTHVSCTDITIDNTVTVNGMDGIRSQTWNIPINFLDLSHEVVGRGRFGSVIKGRVNRQGWQNANVQVVPAKILEDNEIGSLIKDLDTVLSNGHHPNLVGLIGICEDKDTMFVVVEECFQNLKTMLLANRHPGDLHQGILLSIMMDMTQGLNHLSRQGLVHKKLCSRNIYLTQNYRAKIGSVGITDYVTQGQDPDLIRWTAPEVFKQVNYVWKCDIWSLGVVFWECLTLGATPYSHVPGKEVPFQVMRGMRLAQPKNVTDEFYQLLLMCWQVDLDERPAYEEILDYLRSLNQSTFSIPSSPFENYKLDLELQ